MICACVLSSGNEQTIGDAVRSVLPLVDRVLIVDTGIIDDTLSVAAAAAGEKLIVLQFAWCGDFAAARNYCLDAVSRYGGEWYLMLDSDETVVPAASALPLTRQLQQHFDVDCWLIADETGSYYRERVIRVASAARWSGRTHEALIGLRPDQKRVLPGVHVASRPKSAEAFRAKLERDLVALNRELLDHPDDPRWWYYSGQTLEGLQRYGPAADAYRRCWTLPGWSEQSAWACFRAAVCLAELDEHAAALETCAVGLARDGRFPELAWLAGWLCYQLGRYPEAVTWAETAAAIAASGVCEARIGFRHVFGWREGPQDLLTWSYRQLAERTS